MPSIGKPWNTSELHVYIFKLCWCIPTAVFSQGLQVLRILPEQVHDSSSGRSTCASFLFDGFPLDVFAVLRKLVEARIYVIPRASCFAGVLQRLSLHHLAVLVSSLLFYRGENIWYRRWVYKSLEFRSMFELAFTVCSSLLAMLLISDVPYFRVLVILCNHVAALLFVFTMIPIVCGISPPLQRVDCWKGVYLLWCLFGKYHILDFFLVRGQVDPLEVGLYCVQAHLDDYSQIRAVSSVCLYGFVVCIYCKWQACDFVEFP